MRNDAIFKAQLFFSDAQRLADQTNPATTFSINVEKEGPSEPRETHDITLPEFTETSSSLMQMPNSRMSYITVTNTHTHILDRQASISLQNSRLILPRTSPSILSSDLPTPPSNRQPPPRQDRCAKHLSPKPAHPPPPPASPLAPPASTTRFNHHSTPHSTHHAPGIPPSHASFW